MVERYKLMGENSFSRIEYEKILMDYEIDERYIRFVDDFLC